MSVKTAKKSNAEVVQALKAEALKNKVFQSIAVSWAMRERARYNVTVGALQLSLAREGFKFDRKELEKVLTFLASQGIGKLEVDKNGRVKGIIDLRYTLQSIGKAAAGEAEDVKRFKQQRRYKNLPAPLTPPTEAAQPPTPPMSMYVPPTSVQNLPESKKHQVFIAVVLNGKIIRYPLHLQMSSDEVLEFIADVNKEVVRASHQ